MKDINQFIEDLTENDALRNQMAVSASDEASLNATLERLGYGITARDIKEYADRMASGEIDEDSLRKVAGGSSLMDLSALLEALNLSDILEGVFGK